MQAQFLTDTVEYHHLIVDRVTYCGQDSADEGLVNLHAEGSKTPKQCVSTEDENNVNNQCNDRADREGYIAETYQNVDEDADDCPNHTKDCTIGDVFCDRGANLLAANDRTACTYVTVDEGFQSQILSKHATTLKNLKQLGFYLAVYLGSVLIDTVVGADTQGVAVCTKGNGVGVAALKGVCQKCVSLLGSNLILEHYHEVTSTSEVDALAETAEEHATECNDSSNTEDCEANLVCRHELVCGVLEADPVADWGLELEVLPPATLHSG